MYQHLSAQIAREAVSTRSTVLSVHCYYSVTQHQHQHHLSPNHCYEVLLVTTDGYESSDNEGTMLTAACQEDTTGIDRAVLMPQA